MRTIKKKKILIFQIIKMLPLPFPLRDIYGVMVFNDSLIFNVYRPSTYFSIEKIK